MILQNINREIENEYGSRRVNAENEKQARKKKVYSELPALEETDRLINTLGSLIGYSVMGTRPPAGIANSIPERFIGMSQRQLNDEIRKLEENKKKLIEDAGYNSGYIDDVYMCGICRDTGILQNNGIQTACACRKEMLAQKLKKAAGISADDTFDKFNPKFYSDTADQEKFGTAVSPRVLMESVYKICVRFAENFDDPEVKNMVFAGSTGLGKTFLANCIMNYLTDRGVSCLYTSASSLFKPFAPGYYGDDNAAEKADFIMTCELLVIDDLGSEKQTDTRYSELLDILNERAARKVSHRCKTIITTNLSPNDIYSYYGERVASRILGEYALLKFAGEDIRLKRKLLPCD